MGQVELVSVCAARSLWNCRLKRRRVLWLIYNESARLALIANVLTCNGFIRHPLDNCRSGDQLANSQCYERVPTASNLADGPSRLRFEEARSLGFDIVNADRVMSSYGRPFQN